MARVEEIPDSIWLSIFANLDIRTIVVISAVNRQFYRLSCDKLFWKRLDLTVVRSLTLKKLHQLIRSPRMIHVTCLRWEGGLRRQRSQNESISPALLQMIGERCPKLKELHLTFGNLKDLSLEDFPQTLTRLGFEGSIISFDFFASLQNPQVLPNLIGLDLNDVHQLSSLSRNSVPAILGRGEALLVLLVKNNFKLSEEHVVQIPSRLRNLQKLNVSYLTTVSNDFCAKVGEFCDQLTDLDLSFCRKLTDEGVTNLTRRRGSPSPLRRLHLIELGLTDEIFESLSNMPHLEYANLVKSRLTAPAVAAFTQQHPRCRVDHKFSESLLKIGSSFWIVNTDDDEEDVNVFNQIPAPMEH